MSHELRTPLNAIIGFSAILSDEGYTDLDLESRYGYCRDIHTSGQHLLELINDILELSKIEAGKLDPELSSIDLSDIVSTCARLQDIAVAEAGISLKVKILGPLPKVRADGRMVRQALLNLLSNAIKFTGRGGYVVILMDSGEKEVSIVVQDNGIGKKPEDIPKALEPFGQLDSGLDRRFEGTGLGLPLSHALIKVQGGEFRIASELEKGTSVLFTLPRDLAEDRLVRDEERSAESAA